MLQKCKSLNRVCLKGVLSQGMSLCLIQAGDHMQAAESTQDSIPSTSYGSTTSASSTRWDAKKRAVKVPQLQMSHGSL